MVQDRFIALILGDVIGQPGCRALFVGLQGIVRKTGADIVLVNGENAAAGLGITPEIALQFFSSGISVITTGNHVWQKREILPFLDEQERILRPANYPPGAAGRGTVVVPMKGKRVGVINLQGRERMTSIDCPFRSARELVRKMRHQSDMIFIDFHAESVEEKESLAWYLDGEVTAVVGTHTHIQTADERILPKGTAFITDIGSTGPEEGVIGIRKDIAIERVLTQIPIKMEVADTTAAIHGVRIEVDAGTGRALSIERIRERSIV